MSRIGKLPVAIPEKVEFAFTEGVVTIKGPGGELAQKVPAGIKVEQVDNQIVVTRENDSREQRARHGLVRSLIANMVLGVHKGFRKELEINGVGYAAELTKGKDLLLKLGFTHSILYRRPEGVTIEVPKPTTIIISGIDKQLVGQVAADIRAFKKPEPYKGKGIRYKGEYVAIKAGKTAKK